MKDKNLRKDIISLIDEIKKNTCKECMFEYMCTTQADITICEILNKMVDVTKRNGYTG